MQLLCQCGHLWFLRISNYTFSRLYVSDSCWVMAAFKEGFITLNYVPTHVVTWGGWIEDSSKSKFKDLLLVFTGNPGVAMFYTEFLQQLHDKLKMPIWVVSHAGHELPQQDRWEIIYCIPIFLLIGYSHTLTLPLSTQQVNAKSG